MTTSLAQQLNALKISQKDALVAPKRSRISLLFDSKQAANIDDQTLYYICKAGIKHLKENRVIDLTEFESDILDEKSLSFYRGTETKETLAQIDERLDTLLKALSPYLLEQSTLKVIEYLLRIYEVHVYHKVTLIQAFIPLFETLYFLRIIQCLNLKEDQTWGWLHQFAYEGVSIDKTTLIKCISRQNGLVFCKIASFVFIVKGELHIKFFGVFLSEVLKVNSQEGLMFGVLPYISQGLKQSESKDLRISCLLALGQLACRRTLTKEYTTAFVRQILLMISSKDRLEFDEDQKIKGLTSLLFFTQYQDVRLDSKDFSYLSKIAKLNKLLEQLSKQFDTSSLALVIVQSSLEQNISQEETQKLLIPLINLKTVFLLTQTLCFSSCESEIKIKATRKHLEMIKSLAPEQFQQSIVYILKQTVDPSQKESVIKLLQEGDIGNLIVTYGEKEYSILSALSSQKQMTRQAALNSLNQREFVDMLSKKETGLVSMVLLQIISGSGIEEQQFLQIINALRLVSELTDADFGVLLDLSNKLCDNTINYSKGTKEICIDLLCEMKLKNIQNQKIQAWLSFQNKAQLNSENPYVDIVLSKKGKDPIEYVVSKILERTQQYVPFLLGVFSQNNASVDNSILAKVVKKLGVAVQKDLLQTTVQNQLFCPMLTLMKKTKVRNSYELLNAILEGVTADQIHCKSKLINKLLTASLIQKQYWGQSFDLVQLHKKMSVNSSKFAEILLNAILTSKSKLKRMFAIQVIISIHQKGNHPFQLNSQLSHKIMIGAVLMLFNDADKQIREGAAKLAEVMLETQKLAQKDSTLAVIEVFADTDKPQSVQKKPNHLTPIKSKTVSSLLEDLLAAKADLIVDQGQLRIVLSKHQKLEVYEEILRSLLDYPTPQLQQKLLEVLSLPQKHCKVFYINLAQVLSKLFTQISNNQEESVQLVESLGSLITQLYHSQPQDLRKEVFSSLSLPYLRFITEKANYQMQTFRFFEDNLTTALNEVEQKHLVEIFKLFIRSKPQQKLRLLFNEHAAKIYKGDDLALCLTDQYDLELVLETIISLQPTQSNKLFQKSVKTLKQIIDKFFESQDLAYQIELLCQLIRQIAPNKSDQQSQILEDIFQATNQVWFHTKTLTSKSLQREQETRFDPFQEFLADEKQIQSDEEMSEDQEIDLLPCLQVLSSILNLLTQIEQMLSFGQIEKTNQILSEIADYIQLVCKTKSTAASQQSGIKSQLYHLYQSLVLRTAQRPSDGRFYSELITKYLTCSVYLIQQGGMIKLLGEGNLVLNTIKNLPEYNTLILLVLLWLSSQSKLEVDQQNQIKVGLETGAALYLANQTLLWSIDFQQNVESIRDILFNLHQVVISKDKFNPDFKTEQLFGQQPLNFQWFDQFEKIIRDSDSKSLRRFIFFVCTILNQWLAKTPQYTQRISLIAGVEKPSQEVQNQLLQIVISSYLIKDQISNLLQIESSDSLTRLQNSINTLQSTLNQMMSLQIHILIVMKILDMTPQTLKQNILCLLLDKIATFTSGWMSKCQKSLHNTIENLIDKCLTLLENGNNQENLTQLLLTLISRTASPSLSKTMQIRSLETTMKYHKGSLQLQTQTILTEMNLMEIYSFQMLDYFHLFLKHTLEGFHVRKDLLFLDTYKHALLKSLVCISQVFLKFLSADQLEQVISLSILAAAEKVIVAHEGDLVQVILESISSEASQHKKLVLQATMNTYQILLEHAKNDNFESIAVRYFQQLLLPVIRRLPQSYISENHEKFVIFFKQMFSLPQKAESSSPLIVQCFSAFTLKLNEETLRPIIVQLSKWTAKESKRRLVFFQVLCGCLETLREFFVPMIKIYFEQVYASLTESQKVLNVSRQGKRTHQGSQPEETFVLLKQICKLIELNYKFDTDSFLQNDTFEALCDPIADLFDLTEVVQFDKFVDHNLKPLILEMDERSNDDGMWLKLNYTLLMKTRSEQWQTRLAVLSIIEHMFDKMRERYLVILNDTIPFISELLEDEDERVEQAAKRIVLRIEQLTGESINEYLK